MEELKIPKCMSELKDKKAQKGGKTFFQMKVRGDPAPEVKWFFNDKEIENDDHFQMSVKEADFIYRLDVSDVTEEHYGKVKIVATNENGESFKEVIEFTFSLPICYYVPICQNVSTKVFCRYQIS